jgi:hypothetical protein
VAVRLCLLAVAFVLITGACTRAVPDLDDGIAATSDTDATDDAIPPSLEVPVARFERVVHVPSIEPPPAIGRVHIVSPFRPPR